MQTMRLQMGAERRESGAQVVPEMQTLRLGVRYFQEWRWEVTPVIAERWEKLEGLHLKSGAHSPNSTFCVMEAVAYVAGEPWSDHPECACPVISTFLRSWNDALPTDADRDRLLKPLIRDLVGTRSTAEVENRRATMCADWLVRVNAPAWLRLAGLTVHADALEALPEITDFEQCPSLMGTLNAARQDADAVWDAARAA